MNLQCPTPLRSPCAWIFLVHSNGAAPCGSSLSFESEVNHILLNACMVIECRIASALQI